ncbi:hypothetical protein [Lactobacillus delbrueckii]|uniref:hypothetical protein n=1 Tax=Lactobacillus delbrueckii TaxID=1584 RepID=UPI0037CB62FE
MYYNCLVNIPKNTGKISRNKRGKTTYIEYTYAREYLPEKKYNVARRTTIGKADPDHPGMIFPNPNFEKFFPNVEIPAEGTAAEPVNESRSSCIRIGAFSVVRRIIEDYKLAEHLKRWDDRGGVKAVGVLIKFPRREVHLLVNAVELVFFAQVRHLLRADRPGMGNLVVGQPPGPGPGQAGGLHSRRAS